MLSIIFSPGASNIGLYVFLDCQSTCLPHAKWSRKDAVHLHVEVCEQPTCAVVHPLAGQLTKRISRDRWRALLLLSLLLDRRTGRHAMCVVTLAHGDVLQVTVLQCA
jgi:hypothetical protein